MVGPKTEFGKRVMVLGGIATSLVAIVGALTVIGLEPPKPVWSSDLERVDKQFLEVDEKILEVAGKAQSNELSILIVRKSGLQAEIWAQQDRIERLKSDGLPIKDARDRLRDMFNLMEQLEREINHIVRSQ